MSGPWVQVKAAAAKARARAAPNQPAASGGSGEPNADPKCNSELMRALILSSMHEKPSVAKRQIQVGASGVYSCS